MARATGRLESFSRGRNYPHVGQVLRTLSSQFRTPSASRRATRPRVVTAWLADSKLGCHSPRSVRRLLVARAKTCRSGRDAVGLAASFWRVVPCERLPMRLTPCPGSEPDTDGDFVCLFIRRVRVVLCAPATDALRQRVDHRVGQRSVDIDGLDQRRQADRPAPRCSYSCVTVTSACESSAFMGNLMACRNSTLRPRAAFPCEVPVERTQIRHTEHRRVPADDRARSLDTRVILGAPVVGGAAAGSGRVDA
jgi:hypothetical protein